MLFIFLQNTVAAMAYTNLCGYYYSSRWAVTARHFCALCCSITKCMQDHSKEAILSNSMILIVVANSLLYFVAVSGKAQSSTSPQLKSLSTFSYSVVARCQSTRAQTYTWVYVGVFGVFLLRRRMVIPSTRRTTLGDRAFSVTAARAWNALPSSVRSAPPLLQFRRDLKTALRVSVIVLFTVVSSCVTDCNF